LPNTGDTRLIDPIGYCSFLDRVSFRKLVLPFSLGGRISNYVEANLSTE
jgi:hypothetical protein